jgi:hypothetical protein
MRSLVSTVVGLSALAPILVHRGSSPTQATPLWFDTGPRVEPVELVTHTCGYGWRRSHWRDEGGQWHWGTCISIGAN